MLFISSKKIFLFLSYSNCCNFSPSFSHFPNSKGRIKAEIIYDVMNWLHKLEDAIFGISQKPLYITSLNLVR